MIYRVAIERTTRETGLVDVEASSEGEAKDRAFDAACRGDVDWKEENLSIEIFGAEERGQ